ncbi:MAG TPA: hypothetical protein DCS97_12180 [Planctomycetes bacterium]|nr:hypothetical protein [Planctomycetota bacterium]
MPSRVHSSVTLPPAPADGWHLLRTGHITCAAGYRIERTRHAGHEWLLCLRGRGTAWCGAAHCTAVAGDLLWLDNALPHGHEADADEPWELLWVRCHGPDLGRWRERLGGDRCLRSVPRDGARIASRLRDLLHLAGERDRLPMESWSLRIQAGLTSLLADIATGIQSGTPDARDPVVARCQAAMLADLGGDWHVRRLVQTARTPSSSLYRRFLRACGAAPLAWLRQRRLERAAELLSGAQRPVAEVATAVGFSDPFHFSREFRIAFGMAPRDYRKAESCT